MRRIVSKRLRQIAAASAKEYIGQPHYTVKTAAGEIKKALFGLVKYLKNGKEERYVPKGEHCGTIRCHGTRRVYRDLKRRYTQACTRAEKRAILGKTTGIGYKQELEETL
jgi:hypothetical protein